MKSLILAAGKGTRLYPATKKTSKPLMPIAGKETLSFIVDEILDNNVTEIGIVVSNENKEEISLFVKKNYPDFKISLITQEEQLGVAHAVKISKDFINNDDFLLYLGDNLFEDGISNLVAAFIKSKKNIIAIKSVDNPKKFGVASLNKQGELTDIVEKPSNPPTSFAVAGIYGFKNNIYDHIEKISVSKRGEYEITDAIKSLIDNGEIIKTQVINGWWIDTGNIDDFLKANEFKLNINNNFKLPEDSNISDSNIGPNCLILNLSQIINSQITDYTSIGKKVNIANSIITNSIILDNSTIKNYKLKNCILSKGTSLINTSPNMKIIENKII